MHFTKINLGKYDPLDITHIYLGIGLLIERLFRVLIRLSTAHLLVFPLYPDFHIAILFVFSASPAILVQVLIIILLFEQLFKVLGFIDRRW